MTKVICQMTDCKYNSSCCSSPHESVKTYCTKENISLVIDEDLCQLECKEFQYGEDTKKVECEKCQILKYGGIKINKPISFDIHNIE